MFDECVLLLCFTATIRGEYRLPKIPTRETRLLWACSDPTGNVYTCRPIVVDLTRLFSDAEAATTTDQSEVAVDSWRHLISRRCDVAVQWSRRAPEAIRTKILLRAKNYFRHAKSKVRMRCLDLGLRQAILLLHFLSSAVANRNSQAFSFCIRRYIKVVASSCETVSVPLDILMPEFLHTTLKCAGKRLRKTERLYTVHCLILRV